MEGKIIKCAYEDGYFKPLEPISLKNTRRISIMVVEKPKHMMELSRERYCATATESKTLSQEALHIENEVDEEIPWEK